MASAAASDSEWVSRTLARGIRWLVRWSCAPPWLGEVLIDPDRFLADSAHLIADSPLVTMGPITKNPEGPMLLLRRLNYGRIRHRLRDVFRPTRAERAFWRGIGLEKAGVSTPRVLAAGAHRFCRWPIRAYLVTEWVPNATTILEMLNREHKLPREVVYRLADVLARLHNHGFSHRDLNASNVLLSEHRQPILIDLDGVHRIDPLDERAAVEDLARFAWEFVQYPQFLRWNGRRFLKRYCAQRHLEPARRRLEAEVSRPILRRLALGMTYWKR